MDNLVNKYEQGKLTQEELLKLREEVNSQSDDEIEEQLLHSYVRCFSTLKTQESDDKMRKTILSSSSSDKHWGLAKLFLRIAAVLVIGILGFSVWRMSTKLDEISNNGISVATNAGEKATVTLPDGSKVSLNTESSLMYNPAFFNQDNRNVTFEGEGFFSVAKNPKMPFVICSEELSLRVLGTKFDYKMLKHSESIEITVVEGRVELQSKISNNKEILTSGHKAVFNRMTGTFGIEEINDVDKEMAWTFNNLSFANAPLSEVFDLMKSNFGVNINYDYYVSTLKNDHFTGTLPADNLNESMVILCQLYNFDYCCVGKNVSLSKRNNFSVSH